jgi:hypothetical protein
MVNQLFQLKTYRRIVLKIKITFSGGLSINLPNSQDIVKGGVLNIRGALDALVRKHGQILADELFDGEDLKEGLALLINGRNVLSLPKKYQTLLNDKDEIIITTQLEGG